MCKKVIFYETFFKQLYRTSQLLKIMQQDQTTHNYMNISGEV